MIRALLFDFDGTLVDSETPEFEAYRALYAHHGAELDLAEWAGGIGTVDGYRPIERLRELTATSIDRAQARGFAHARYAELADPGFRPGVTSLLAEADAHGLTRAVVSSSTKSWVHASLARAGDADGWAGIWCADGEGIPPKPDPTLFRMALEGLEVAPHEALVFEDSPNGIAAARAAGIRCIAVANPVTSRLDLSGAERVFDSFEQVSLGLLGV